ncbi:MAG TPA: type II toxin-antitoxin system RelE/ParE family toxin [Pirellulales bacterium]|nr:type II toxin-antitoxin system RelE/ParE family toxin [Pirellulales bacterium]
MRLEAEFRPLARADLIECAQYVGQVNPDVGERFRAAVDGLCAQIVANPSLGQVVEAPTGTNQIRVRSVPGFRSYLVLYRVAEDRIDVVRVLHAARDWQHLLGE